EQVREEHRRVLVRLLGAGHVLPGHGAGGLGVVDVPDVAQPSSGSSNSAMSPAAYTSGELVRREGSTTTAPRSRSRPACAARFVFSSAPRPSTTTSAPRDSAAPACTISSS